MAPPRFVERRCRLPRLHGNLPSRRCISCPYLPSRRCISCPCLPSRRAPLLTLPCALRFCIRFLLAHSIVLLKSSCAVSCHSIPFCPNFLSKFECQVCVQAHIASPKFPRQNSGKLTWKWPRMCTCSATCWRGGASFFKFLDCLILYDFGLHC